MIRSTQGKNNNVMPVGSSWVICDSKSRPGFKYYFNTESGKAVWNLSNKDQIEKAKKHTQILQTKLGTVPELPEPQDQPPMDARRNFNLPILNNMPNYCNFLNTGARHFNNNDWVNSSAVMQQPQIVLVPTVAPMLNPSIGNNNLPPTMAFQNVLPFTYQNNGNYHVPYDNSNSGNVPYNISNNRRRNFFRNKVFERNEGQNSTTYRQRSGDLRQKLARKRTLSESNLPPLLVSTQDYFNSNSNDSEDNSPTTESQPESPDYQDTEKNVNKLTANTFKLNDCYVVVDKDIIMNEFVFFDNLISNDSNFLLVVPHHVMSELKSQACRNGEARVRRIVRFLSQKIESRLVCLGEEIEDNGCQNEEKTFITCEQLLEKDDNNIILVSNKNELKKFIGNNDKIKIMSMCKFKDMLSNTKARFTSPTRGIKIIIPNNLRVEEEAKTSDNDSIRKNTNVESQTTNVVRNAANIEGNTINVESYVETNDIGLKSLPSPSSKQTVDTAVQTEINAEVNETRIFSDNYEVVTPVKNENTTKKREIRLNRITSMKTAKIEETSDNKKYKWRKNRASRNQSNDSKRTQSTLNNSTETTTNIAAETIKNAARNKIPNVTVTESKQKDNSNQTENSFTIPIIDCEQVKMMPYFVSENDPKIHKEVFRQTSTESWIESLPNSKNDTDKDSRSSSYRTESFTSTLAKDVNSVVHKVAIKPVNKEIVLKNAEMFTVAGHNMEEVLRMRSDEWVSRFVQIMEEILKEKLQENPPFDNDEYPPPWNLHEAARCIIKKYSNYFNVVDAANKLSFILYKVSDEKGKIPLNLPPSEFMEMYSYGVYLVETLQDVSSTNYDDFYAAKESLKTLLYDIQNANTENSCSDIFGDDLHESLVEYTTSTDITESDFRPGQEKSPPKEKIQKRCATRTKAKKKIETKSLYNLRKAKKTSEVPEVSQSKSSSVDKKINFFSNLKLMTRSISSPSTITSPAYSTLTVRSPMKSPVKSPLPVATKVIDNKRGNDTSKNKEPITNDEEIVTSSGQPNFVRNFQVCPEFEARINKARNILELNDCDQYYSDDGQCDDNAFHFNMSQYFEPKNCVLKNNTLKDIDIPVRNYDISNKNEFKKFGWSFGLKLRVVKETFADVIKFISVSKSDPSKREEFKSIALKIFPRIENIYNTFDNILKKDNHGDNNIKEILQNVNATSAEEEMFYLQYRFHKNINVREKWLKMRNREEWVPKKYSTLCSKHFETKYFSRRSAQRILMNIIAQFRDQAYNIIKYLKLTLRSS